MKYKYMTQEQIDLIRYLIRLEVERIMFTYDDFNREEMDFVIDKLKNI